MPAFEPAPDLHEIAKKLIGKIETIDHVDLDEILFLRETETRPKALAKCFKFGDHPIAFFTDKKYAIVVYQAVADYLSKNQLVYLVLHELKHIPSIEQQLIKHNIQDFQDILEIDLSWSEPGREVPDILKNLKKLNAKKPTQANSVGPDKKANEAARSPR